MDKLVERESSTRNPLVAAPALAAQFFLIPLAVVAVTVTVYVGFRSLTSDRRTPQEYLAEIRAGGLQRQWPAAFELSRLMGDPKVRADRSLAPLLVEAFEQARDNDPRVRRYLALALGRLDPPLPPAAVAALSRSLDEPSTTWKPDVFSRLNGWSDIDINEARITTIWALGASGDAGVVPRLLSLYESADAAIRKIVVYALGALPGDAQLATLREALRDSAADVRWNAAMALARHGSHDGLQVIRQMLDRQHVAQEVTREARQDQEVDPVADVIVSGLRAAAVLGDPALRDAVASLSRDDPSLRVRSAALEALKAMSPGTGRE